MKILKGVGCAFAIWIITVLFAVTGYTAWFFTKLASFIFGQ